MMYVTTVRYKRRSNAKLGLPLRAHGAFPYISHTRDFLNISRVQIYTRLT